MSLLYLRLTDFDLCLESDVGAALGGEVPDVHDVPRRLLGVRLVVAVGLGQNSIDILGDIPSLPLIMFECLQSTCRSLVLKLSLNLS